MTLGMFLIKIVDEVFFEPGFHRVKMTAMPTVPLILYDRNLR